MFFIYKHFIWDFDGTLFDTYPAMVQAVLCSLQDLGIQEDFEVLMSHMKISVPHTLAYCKEKYGVGEELKTLLDHYRVATEQGNITPFSGVQEICAQIVQCGGANYLYTHRGTSAIEYLQQFGLYPYFADFVTKENGFARKPSPQAITYLLQKHHIPNTQALMIGDRDIDILSAKNAGIATCFFENSDYGKVDFADYTITDVQQMSGLFLNK